jgi:hypothetical protein
MSNFKPCPFCGCHVPPAVQGNGIGDNWLECTECGASTRLREDGAGSEKDWNRRAARATAEQSRDSYRIDATPGVVHIQELMLKWVNAKTGQPAKEVWNEIEAALHSLAATAHMDGYAAGVKDLQEFSTLINREKA